MDSTIEEMARIAQREYQKKWRKNNREKVAAINQRYWAKKAQAALAASETREDNKNDEHKD